jgi:cysteine desulfurase
MTYLDNAATTAVCSAAADKALYMMTTCFGNPSSLHAAGVAAERELTAAREAVAALIGASPETVVFTAGGTEANNLAVLGSAAANARVGRHAITSAVEHASVSAAFDELERQGFEVTRLVPDEGGMVTAEAVAAACRPDTALVSVMLVNNETGARFPVEEMIAEARRLSPRALFHTDAVQAAGKLPLKAQKWGVDLLTVSGHKLHAPKGVGALYIRRGVRILPRAVGGGQEGGMRAGTEAAPAIAAFGAAAAAVPDLATLNARFEALYQRLTEGLAAFPNARLHVPAVHVPYLLNVSLPGLRSETMLHFLAERGVFVSGGSACSKGKQSPVLKALGLPAAEIDSALRISFCRDTTEEDIDRFLAALHEADAALTRVAAFRRRGNR